MSSWEVATDGPDRIIVNTSSGDTATRNVSIVILAGTGTAAR